MPDLPLNAAQRARVAQAFAFLNEDRSNATPAQVDAWVQRQLKSRVIQYEQGLANSASDTAIQEALEGEGW